MNDWVDKTAQLASDGGEDSSSILPASTLLNGRYQLQALLGRGGMGVVYQASDLLTGRDVALKMLRAESLSTTSLALFKAEFMTLGTLSHPNIAVVHDFAQREGSADFFFTMDLVSGKNALDSTAGAGFDAVLGILLQVLRALAYLHTRNVVHLDLKPANILVTPEGAARVVDFGIARSAFSELSGRYATPTFTAPEAWHEGAVVDRRADIYSFGVTLFQLLFRRLPLDDAEWYGSATFASGFALTPQELASVPPWIPQILPRLVARNPAQRFRSANEVIAAINEASGGSYEIETDQTWDSYVASATLVGQGPALDALLGSLQERLRSGCDEALLLLCSGPKGSGKSRLLREIRQHCQVGRHLFVEGHCYGEAQAPYAVWEGLIAQVATLLVPELDAHRGLLCQLAPALAARLGLTAESTQLDVQQLAKAIVDLLLASGRPCVIAIADLHWIDEHSLELLELVVEGSAELQRERSVRLAFLCTSRLELSERQSQALQRLRASRVVLDVALRPLSAAQVGELVASMLGTTDMPAELSAGLTEATEGNALLVAEMVHAWIKDGSIAPQASGWTFRRSRSALEINRQLTHLLSDRLTDLSPLELSVLRALAAFGRPLHLGLLERLLGVGREAVLQLAQQLQLKQLAFSSQDQLQFSAARWRDVVLEGISAQALVALHAQLAELLEPDLDAGLVAYHYQRGERHSLAATWYGRAALDSFRHRNLKQVLDYAEQAETCGADTAHFGQVWAAAAEAGRLCSDPRAVTFANRAIPLLAPGSPEWMQASRVAIAMFNPLLKS